MQKEPTLHQLEKLISAFRVNGGTDAELSTVAREIMREFYPSQQKPLEEVFSKDDHPTIAEIKSFKNNPEPPMKSLFSKIWGNRFIRYPLMFVATFLVFFAVLNFPLLVTKFTPTKEVKYETYKEVLPQQMDKSAPLEPGEVIPSINTLVVPKISVSAPVQFINSNKEADIQEALRNGVVHYFGTAYPGEIGNPFITGHSSNYWWEKGGYNYIFANLDKLAVGDQAKIYYSGNKYLYQVKEILVVDPTNTSVLDQTNTRTMTLMTCTPPGTNWKRLIVKFDQISPSPKAPVVVEKKREIETTKLPSSDSNPLFDWLGKLFRN